MILSILIIMIFDMHFGALDHGYVLYTEIIMQIKKLRYSQGDRSSMRYTLSVLLDIKFYINQGYEHHSSKDQRRYI